MPTIVEQHEYHQQEFVERLSGLLFRKSEAVDESYDRFILVVARTLLGALLTMRLGADFREQDCLAVVNETTLTRAREYVDDVVAKIEQFTSVPVERQYLITRLFQKLGLFTAVGSDFYRMIMHEPHLILGGEPAATPGDTVLMRQQEVKVVSFEESKYAAIFAGTEEAD